MTSISERDIRNSTGVFDPFSGEWIIPPPSKNTHIVKLIIILEPPDVSGSKFPGIFNNIQETTSFNKAEIPTT